MWVDDDPGQEEVSVNLDPDTTVDGEVWPVDSLDGRRAEVERAAAQVRQFRRNLDGLEPLSGEDSQVDSDKDSAIQGDLSQVWELETTLLIDELQRQDQEAIKIPMPVQLSTSEYQALMRDREEFARRKARPVPFKPNRFARRGTAFHAWLENHFGVQSLLDDEAIFEDQLSALLDSPETATEANWPALKEKFLASQWADKVPEFVEVPFEIGIGSHRVVGRIDAIFKIDDTWVIVDWKTGRKPYGQQAQLAALQLAIYRIAWADRRRQAGEKIDAENIRAAFFYVGSQETVEPDASEMPSRLELDRQLRKYLEQQP